MTWKEEEQRDFLAEEVLGATRIYEPHGDLVSYRLPGPPPQRILRDWNPLNSFADCEVLLRWAEQQGCRWGWYLDELAPDRYVFILYPPDGQSECWVCLRSMTESLCTVIEAYARRLKEPHGTDPA